MKTYAPYTKEELKLAQAATRQASDELNATPRHLLNEGNPNHPRYDLHIFGEHVDSFMARQYRAGRDQCARRDIDEQTQDYANDL